MNRQLRTGVELCVRNGRELSALLTAQHSPLHWNGTKTAKYADTGVTRSMAPSRTVNRVRALMSRIGVTRIGEVTYLDRNGVPGFIAVRPRDLGPAISYYNGKGTTRDQARASAMMEAIERYSGESCHLPVGVFSIAAARRISAIVDPCLLTAPLIRPLTERSRLEWVVGFDLIASRPTLVPLNAVVCPYQPKAVQPFAYCSTNGLASGNTLAEALSHALCEINERDAMALASTQLALCKAISAITDPGVRRSGTGVAEGCYPQLSHEALPRRAARVLNKLKSAGLRVYLRNITSDTRIPTIDCTVVEERWDGFVAHAGFGSHPDARVALLRAMTEAAQSRVACIQGGREDLPEFATNSATIEDPESCFGAGAIERFSQMATYGHEHIEDDIAFILRRFSAAGLKSVVAVDLTHPTVGIPVVRAIVPEAETWSVFHLHTKRGKMGSRVSRMVRGAQ